MQNSDQPIDLRHLDATLTNLRAAARDAEAVVALMSDVRDRVATAPDDPETRDALHFAVLRMRGTLHQIGERMVGMAHHASVVKAKL